MKDVSSGDRDSLFPVFTALCIKPCVLSDTACNQGSVYARFFVGFCVEIGWIDDTSECGMICLHDVVSVICFLHCFALLSFGNGISVHNGMPVSAICGLPVGDSVWPYYVFLRLHFDFSKKLLQRKNGLENRSPVFWTGKELICKKRCVLSELVPLN